MERSVSGAAVLDKAVAILAALEDGPLGLGDLARRTGIVRPTAHRLCAALEYHGLIRQDSADRRYLGPRLARWGHLVADADAQLVAAAEGPLRSLRDSTGESVQLYVRESDSRRVVAGLESAHGLRTIVEVGAVLPIDVGSAGAILRQVPEAMQRGWAQSVEERERGVASVSAPVFRGGEVVAAVSVSGPIERTTRAPGRRYANEVVAAAKSITNSLSGLSA